MTPRRMGSGALFRDARDRVLLVRPTYKPGWEIPGGALEPGESPRTCCARELGEELGIELAVGRLLVVDWLPAEAELPDGLMFVFDGGVLDDETTSRFALPPDELSEWRFVGASLVDELVKPRMARRLREALACALDGTVADLEHGFRSRS